MKSRHNKYLTIMAAGITAVMLGLIMAPIQFTNAASPQKMAIKASTDGVVLDFSTEGSRELLTFNLRIIGPERFIFEQSSQSDRIQWIPAEGVDDGYYNWEAWVLTVDPGASIRTPTPALQERPLEYWYESKVKQIHLASGSFRVQHGLVIVNPKDEAEEHSLTKRVASAILEFVFPSAHADTFDDTVTVNRDTTGPRLALFDPTGDGLPWWRIQMTDDPANHLEVRYCDFALFGCGAASEIVPISIRRDTGRVGMGVTAPTARLHMNAETGEDGLRVQVDGLTGLYAHENQGVTIGAFVPPPPRGLHVPAAGSVGLGTVAPAAPLHIRRFDDTPEMILLEQSSGVVQDRNMIQLNNNGGIRFQFDNDALSTQWRFQAATGNRDVFEIAKVGTGAIELELDGSGNLTIQGALTQGSDVNSKRDIEEVDAESVLSKVEGLALSQWSYKTDDDGVRHLGPMAQDFFSVFELGDDDTKIAPADMAGVALAAIQAQQRIIRDHQMEIRKQQTEIDELRNELEGVERLEARLEQMEGRLPPRMVYRD